MFLRALIIIMILLSFGSSVYAKEEKQSISNQDRKKVEEVSLKFARCSAVYEISSSLLSESESPALAENNKQTSNGAYIASAYLISSMGVIPDWQSALKYAEETADTEKVRWRATLEQVGPEKFVKQVTDEMIKCNQMGKFQEELVQEARTWAYSQGKIE